MILTEPISTLLFKGSSDKRLGVIDEGDYCLLKLGMHSLDSYRKYVQKSIKLNYCGE